MTYLTTNPLSQIWKGPSSCKPLYYVAGMITYAVSLVWRVVRLALSILFFVGKLLLSLLPGPQGRYARKLLKEESYCLVGCVCEVFSAVLGILAPPWAYKIDEWIHNSDEVHKTSLFTQWSHEQGEAAEFVWVDSEDTSPTEKARAKRLKNDVPFFRKAKKALDEKGIETSDQSFDQLEKILVLACVFKLKAGHCVGKLSSASDSRATILAILAEEKEPTEFFKKVRGEAQTLSTNGRGDYNYLLSQAYT